MDGKDPASLDVGYFASRITLASDTLDASQGWLGDAVPRGVGSKRGDQIEATLAMLPSLTRTVYLLASVDDLTFREIAWRCGIDVAEVELRLADALSSISREIDGRPRVAMKMRAALLTPWRSTCARWRLQRRHRNLDSVRCE